MAPKLLQRGLQTALSFRMGRKAQLKASRSAIVPILLMKYNNLRLFVMSYPNRFAFIESLRTCPNLLVKEVKSIRHFQSPTTHDPSKIFFQSWW